jgi:arginyl-tRNA synthetase
LIANVTGNAEIDFVSELLERPEVTSHLREPEAAALVFQLARFGEVLRDSYTELESTFLVNYLFRLCNLTSKTLKTLPVKGQDQTVLFARLAMFAAVKAVLRQGMKVLGVKPVDRM